MEDAAVSDIVPATRVGYLPATALGLMAAARAVQRRLQALVLSEGTSKRWRDRPRRAV